MAISCLVGREKLEDREQYGKAMQVAYGIYDRFKEQVGHTLCGEIHKIRYGKAYRLFIPEREKLSRDGRPRQKRMPEVCGIAARIAAEVILDIKGKSSESNPRTL